MKKITALLLCFLLLCTGSLLVFAEVENQSTNTVISVVVPDTHTITVSAQGAQVFHDGVSGEEFVVSRLSEPRLLIRAESGKQILSVTLNGEDVTAMLYGGYLILSPIYEDKTLVVTTQEQAAEEKDVYTVKGTITLNGQPLPNVELELRPTLKTIKTDENGAFTFTKVAPGTHSLTAVRDDKVIGYMVFELKKDTVSNVFLQQNGSYTVSVNSKGAGVELHLVLNEGEGTLVPDEFTDVEKPQTTVTMGTTTTTKPSLETTTATKPGTGTSITHGTTTSTAPSTAPNKPMESPLTGDAFHFSWLWLLMPSILCMVALEIYHRKKA